jgi:hypothetical protein
MHGISTLGSPGGIQPVQHTDGQPLPAALPKGPSVQTAASRLRRGTMVERRAGVAAGSEGSGP